jgi:hypothetical protein
VCMAYTGQPEENPKRDQQLQANNIKLPHAQSLGYKGLVKPAKHKVWV